VSHGAAECDMVVIPQRGLRLASLHVGSCPAIPRKLASVRHGTLPCSADRRGLR